MSNLHKHIIIFLAYCNRYILPISVVAVPFVLANDAHKKFLFMGVLGLILSLYNILGVLLKWKHIYRSLQDISHQTMTPDKINWNKFSFLKKYGLHIFVGIFSFIIFVFSFLNIF